MKECSPPPPLFLPLPSGKSDRARPHEDKWSLPASHFSTHSCCAEGGKRRVCMSHMKRSQTWCVRHMVFVPQQQIRVGSSNRIVWVLTFFHVLQIYVHSLLIDSEIINYLSLLKYDWGLVIVCVVWCLYYCVCVCVFAHWCSYSESCEKSPQPHPGTLDVSPTKTHTRLMSNLHNIENALTQNLFTESRLLKKIAGIEILLKNFTNTNFLL